jgi:hypothetical protein
MITNELEYLGYVDTEYVSPTLIQNYINNYNFDSTSGWTMTGNTRPILTKQPSLSNCCGRFVTEDGTKVFKSIIDDFVEGNYSEDNAYKPYMRLTFTDGD